MSYSPIICSQENLQNTTSITDLHLAESGEKVYTSVEKTINKNMKLPLPPHWRSYVTIQNGALALGLLIAVSWIWGTVGTLNRNFELQQQVDQLDSQIELSKLQNQNLSFQKNYYASGEYLELSARELLGKVAPGERVVILPDSSAIKDTAGVEPTRPSSTDKPSNFSQWMQFFFGKKQAQS